MNKYKELNASETAKAKPFERRVGGGGRDGKKSITFQRVYIIIIIIILTH